LEDLDMTEDKDEDLCVFCRIADGSSPSRPVLEDDMSMAILDISPFSKGHCLVIPKRHVQFWHELSEAETTSLFSVARAAARRIMEEFRPDFVAMYARGRRIPHTHIFLVPTYAGDPLDRFFNALEGFQEATADLARLREPMELDDAMRRLKKGAKS
jgi:histidine triad (HIT) family protein